MNTTPKQQDGEGITAENGVRSSLEQTVLGVPPPSSGVAPASAVQAVVAAPAVPANEDAQPVSAAAAIEPVSVPAVIQPVSPPAIEPVSVPAVIQPVSAPAVIQPVSAPAVIQPISAPAVIQPVSAPAVIQPISAPAAAQPADARGPAIVAAPTISVAPVSAPGAVSNPPVAAPAVLPEPRQQEPHPEAAVGDTMKLARSSAPAVPRLAPRGARASQEPSRADDTQHTALSADYLRDARDAALSGLHGDVTPRAPVAALPREAAPSQPANGVTPRAPLAALPREAAPSQPANSITPRAPAVATPQGRAAETLAAPWMERAPSEAPPSNTGTRPSMAPPFPGPAAVAAERTVPIGSRGFEPVPVLRAPLAESLSGAFGPIAELGSPRHSPPTPRPRAAPSRSRDTAGRWMLLSSVALATVGVVTFGSRVWDRYRTTAERKGALSAAAGAASSSRNVTPGEAPPAAGSAPTSRALMANRPAPEPAGDGRVRVISATGGVAVTGPARDEVPAPGTSPESQLAATAGRHVLTGNYAEALPLYRHLERSWPETTAYAAMSRLLEKKVGTMNDTRTITPAAPSP